METPEELAEQLTRAYQPIVDYDTDTDYLLVMADSYLSLILHRYPDNLPHDLKDEMGQLIIALREAHGQRGQV